MIRYNMILIILNTDLVNISKSINNHSIFNVFK